jgi:hypothetical protein
MCGYSASDTWGSIPVSVARSPCCANPRRELSSPLSLPLACPHTLTLCTPEIMSQWNEPNRIRQRQSVKYTHIMIDWLIDYWWRLKSCWLDILQYSSYFDVAYYNISGYYAAWQISHPQGIASALHSYYDSLDISIHFRYPTGIVMREYYDRPLVTTWSCRKAAVPYLAVWRTRHCCENEDPTASQRNPSFQWRPR